MSFKFAPVFCGVRQSIRVMEGSFCSPGRTFPVDGPCPRAVDGVAIHLQPLRFTAKDDALYAIEMGWPSNRESVIHSLGTAPGCSKVSSVALLGGDSNLSFEQQEDGLHIRLPDRSPGKYAYTFRIVFR